MDAYRAARGARGQSTDNIDLLDAVNTDARFRIPTQRVAGLQRAHEPNTYNYLFTWESPARRGAFGSCHALEMPFVFGTLDAPTQDKFAGAGPEAERLSANMMDAWLAFVRSDNPSHEGIGEWPAWDADRRPVMVFGRESATEQDPFGEERAAIEPFVP
ncbi:MAG: carboxylesterase family protein [Dehalococcoidia bacterium]|nr:carboxylesterase family protein [Dehalococcoidia bacterium]